MIYPVTHDQGGKDKRYTITKEWCGYEEPRFVVRFCDEFIGQSAFYNSAVVMAVGHNAKRIDAMMMELLEAAQ